MYSVPWIKKKSFSRSNSSFFNQKWHNWKQWWSQKKQPFWSAWWMWKWSWISWNTLLKILIPLIGIPFIGGLAWFYVVILSDLPNIADLKEINSFSEASVITDRNGEVLYRIFEENRQYVTIDQISPVLQDAIVATEDESFWSNAWVDFYGFAKAWLLCIIKWTNHPDCRGASTITQQLIKNIYLTNERTIIRKLKEIVLALRIKNVLEAEVRQTNPSLSSTELQQEVKNKVLELYLNYIFLGNNSYGVESASINYFATSAQYLWIIESAILAWIPQAPSRYNVYTNRDMVMGYLSVTDTITNEEVKLDEAATKELYLKAASILSQSTINWSTSQSALNHLRDTLTFDHSYGSGSYAVVYKLGRKDEVLSRMYDTQVISGEELINAVIEWFTYEFKKARIWLTAPHFVFWVRELLESPNNKYMGKFDPEILYRGWLTITTTLDLEIQKMAENAVNSNIKSINWYGAGNTSLIHLDSIKWDILAYVGSADFNNLEIKWQNDMLRAPIQPWSTIKPLWYALGFMKLPLTLDTQIFDIPFKVWDYDPQNADWKFNWPMTLSKALAYSRNIPAVKMYFAAWQQNEFITFAEKMWVTSLKRDANYGPSMAIGSAEMQTLELANMYAHLSAQGKPWVIDPIIEIKAKDGTIIYRRATEQQPQVVPSWVAYLMWKILSDPKNLPSDWVRRFSFPINFAHKTGTSNIRTRDGRRMPKDWWLAAYTPSKVTIFRAWNTTPQALNANAFGGWINNSTWRQFWTDLQKAWHLTDETVPETEVKRVTIAKNSWRLASESTPESQRVSTLAYIGTAPTAFDSWTKQIQVDSLCYGKVSELTPPEDIVEWFITPVTSFMPNNMDLNDIVTYIWWWAKQFNPDWSQSYTVFATEPEQVCPERQAPSTWESLNDPTSQWRDSGIWMRVWITRPTNNASVSNNFTVQFNAQGKTPIKSITLKVNWSTFGTYQYNDTTVSDSKVVSIANAAPWTSHTISVIATDSLGVTSEQSISVKIQATDSRPPYIVRPNTRVVTNAWWYQVTLTFSDLESSVKWWIISQWGKQISTFEGDTAVFVIPTLDVLSFTVRDFYDNSGEGTIDVSPFVQ